jgi:2-amino-4-hydroxy-6-hydroxymethyldihydropteridine diphosphokinase
MSLAYIGMGGNLPGAAGTPEATLAAAAARLGPVVARSSLYSTTPVGFAEQPRFVNAAVALETELSARELLEGLLGVEREFGRDRAAGVKNGPRTLDLDILLFGDLVVSEWDLEIPHPRLAERAFVLVPLNEIAAEARDPRSGATVAQLLEKLFPNREGAMDAVVKVESDVWRAGAGDAAAGGDDARAGRGGDRDHG